MAGLATYHSTDYKSRDRLPYGRKMLCSEKLMIWGEGGLVAISSAKTIFKGKQSQLIIKAGGQILCHSSIAANQLTSLCLPWDIVLLK